MQNLAPFQSDLACKISEYSHAHLRECHMLMKLHSANGTILILSLRITNHIYHVCIYVKWQGKKRGTRKKSFYFHILIKYTCVRLLLHVRYLLKMLGFCAIILCTALGITKPSIIGPKLVENSVVEIFVFINSVIDFCRKHRNNCSSSSGQCNWCATCSVGEMGFFVSAQSDNADPDMRIAR